MSLSEKNQNKVSQILNEKNQSPISLIENLDFYIDENYSHQSNEVKSSIKSLLGGFFCNESDDDLFNKNKMIKFAALDHGFEHGPIKTFFKKNKSKNQINTYNLLDPLLVKNFIYKSKVNAFAAPFGLLNFFNSEDPDCPNLILKMNNSYSFGKFSDYNQYITSSIDDAVNLGCRAIGYTIYFGSEFSNQMIEDFAAIRYEANKSGLATVLWAYPRGSGISDSQNNTSFENISYSVHMSCLLGADVVKTKIPTHCSDINNQSFLKSDYDQNASQDLNSTDLKLNDSDKNSIYMIYGTMKSGFSGRRVILFSGGEKKSENDFKTTELCVKLGLGHGMMVGRNLFQ